MAPVLWSQQQATLTTEPSVTLSAGGCVTVKGPPVSVHWWLSVTVTE